MLRRSIAALSMGMVVLAGCNHPLEVVGEGDIISASGDRNCYAEDKTCTNLVTGDYDETYTAQPRDGYAFIGWENCGSQFPDCTFSVSGDVVRQYWGETSASLIAHFDVLHTATDIPNGFFGFVDAEYDANTGRVIALTGPTVTVTKPGKGTQELFLPSGPGIALSVAPDGGLAAVSQSGQVALIDLTDVSIENVFETPETFVEVVMDGDGFVHGFPDGEAYSLPYSLDTNSGESTIHWLAGTVLGTFTKAALHPSGNKIYSANNGLSPSDIDRYSLSNGMVTQQEDSPYHGEFNFCGDLWIDSLGSSIATKCGVVVRSTDSYDTDMTFIYRLGTGSGAFSGPLGSDAPKVRHAYASEYNREWLVISDNEDDATKILKFDLSNGAEKDALELPLIDGIGSERWKGQFVFSDETDGSTIVLVVDKLQQPTKFSVLHINADGMANNSGNIRPEASVQRFISGLTFSTVSLDASESSDANGDPLSYEWSLVSKPETSTLDGNTLGNTSILDFMPDAPGTYEFQLQVSDGERHSGIKKATVNVFNSASEVVSRLEGDFNDFEFNKVKNSLVFLSKVDNELLILNLSTMKTQTISLSRLGYRLGLSPGGRYLAVSHQEMVSLVDLDTLSVIDEQSHAYGWGDIVLSANNTAHFVPYWASSARFTSVDFVSDTVSVVGDPIGRYNSLRLHPIENWVYGAGSNNRVLTSPSIRKWDVDTFPGVPVDGASDALSFEFPGNLWFEENGFIGLLGNAQLFLSTNSPFSDMRDAGKLNFQFFIVDADHSSEQDEWLIAGRTRIYTFNATRSQTSEFATPEIPTSARNYETESAYVFYTDDGSSKIIIVKSGERQPLADPFAIKIISD